MITIERRIRWYQRDFHQALVGAKYDRLIEIAHRRWGKDEIALMSMCEIALNLDCPKHRIGNYWHCLPEYEQARKAIWEGVNSHTGKRRIDEAFPKELIESSDSTTMRLRFKNGSTYQLIGSDRFNATVGSGPVGVVYSEWALSNPSAWAYHRPMIEESKGWAAFITTPRGQNHAKSMYDMARKNMAEGGRWFAELSDVNHTGALTPAQIEESLLEYKTLYGNDFGLAMFEQEYYCSFSGAMVGAIFGGEMNRAEREERLCSVPINPKFPVHTAWDLGNAANNPIWCFQVIAGKPYVVDFYRPESDDLEEWVRWLNDRGYNGNDYVPHDVVQTQWGTRRTRIETLKLLGRKPKKIVKVAVMEGINAGNRTIRLAKFDAERCALGIDGLKNYRREWDDDLKTFRANPVKDWSEHIGSSFRYMALAWQEEIALEKPPEKPKSLEYVASSAGTIVGNMNVKEAVEAMVRRKRQNG
jgi:phage terminase large subunit